MSIFVLPGEDGSITTTSLPSGDVAVRGPVRGPLEQLMYEVCHWHGRRNPQYGGWIVPATSAGSMMRNLESRATKISK